MATTIFTYVPIEKEEDFRAALMTILGTMTKLYGIVGLALFLFSKYKMKLAGGLVLWVMIVLLLPMFYASPEYVVRPYKKWLDTLVHKSGLSQSNINRDIPLLGTLHRMTGVPFSDLWVIMPGVILFALPYLRIWQYGNEPFRLLFLSSALLFMVLFSAGTETYDYLTAMIAIGIWYVKAPTKAATPILNLSLLIFRILLTSLSTTDLFPRFIRVGYVKPYIPKVPPCASMWSKIMRKQPTQDSAHPSN